MRIVIGKLCVFVFLINFFCFPSPQHASDSLMNGQIVLRSSVTPAEQRPNYGRHRYFGRIDQFFSAGLTMES